MGFMNYAGDFLGFQMGGVIPKYQRSGLYNPGLTREVSDKLQRLFSSAIDALNKGDVSHFLSPEFDSLLEESLHPLRAAYQTNKNSIVEALHRSGVTDPVAIQRYMEDMDRSFGSNVASAGRSMASSKIDFMKNILGLSANYTLGEQGQALGEHTFETQYDAERQLQKDQRSAQQMATLRRYVAMMGGGMGGGMMAGGGGFGGDVGGAGAGGMMNILGSEGGGTSGLIA